MQISTCASNCTDGFCAMKTLPETLPETLPKTHREWLRKFKMAVLCAIILMQSSFALADWSIDFSRRNLKTREADLNTPAAVSGGRGPASVGGSDAAHSADSAASSDSMKSGVLDTFFDTGEPMQDLVILHTEKGFVPSTVRVRKGGRYKVHVVNVNEKDKNVSFMLDAFSEHHATYYGKIKVFVLEPKKEGTFSFQSPETSSEGKMIVFNPQTNVRVPASEE
jgi:Cupredoxin-like domain